MYVQFCVNKKTLFSKGTFTYDVNFYELNLILLNRLLSGTIWKSIFGSVKKLDQPKIFWDLLKDNQDPDTGEINKVKCADKRRPRPRVDKVKPKA